MQKGRYRFETLQRNRLMENVWKRRNYHMAKSKIIRELANNVIPFEIAVNRLLIRKMYRKHSCE